MLINVFQLIVLTAYLIALAQAITLFNNAYHRQRVSLQHRFLSFWIEYCDASLVDFAKIVTAKSCLEGKDVSTLRIIANQDSFFERTVSFIEEIKLHEKDAAFAVAKIKYPIITKNGQSLKIDVWNGSALTTVGRVVTSPLYNSFVPYLPDSLYGYSLKWLDIFWSPWILKESTYEIQACDKKDNATYNICAKVKSGSSGPCKPNLGSAMIIHDKIAAVLTTTNGFSCDAQDNYVIFQKLDYAFIENAFNQV